MVVSFIGTGFVHKRVEIGDKGFVEVRRDEAGVVVGAEVGGSFDKGVVDTGVKVLTGG